MTHLASSAHASAPPDASEDGGVDVGAVVVRELHLAPVRQVQVLEAALAALGVALPRAVHALVIAAPQRPLLLVGLVPAALHRCTHTGHARLNVHQSA